MIERTLVLMKPDALKRGLVGRIMQRFEEAGLKIVATKMVAPDEQHYHQHYEVISQLITRWGEVVYHVTLAHMMEAPVIAMVLEGVGAIEHVRKMVGTTNPKNSLPGTIRGDFTHVSQEYANSKGGTLPNLVHASGNQDEAAQEITLWFGPNEIFDYDTAHGSTIRGRIPTLRGKAVKKKTSKEK